LFRIPEKKTQAVLSGESAAGVSGAGENIFLQIVGRARKFEADLPKDFTMQKGDQAVLPRLDPYVLAIAETIISDSRDPFNQSAFGEPGEYSKSEIRGSGRVKMSKGSPCSE